MTKDIKQYFKTNATTWNKKVEIHAASSFYDLNGFKKGASSLNQYELEALGDVTGKTLLHLQCHFGMDTLSWSRMGAKCTGVDLSDQGIKLAKQLNTELQLDASFTCCNVLDTAIYIKDTFDIIYTSYGVIGWLPDLKPWGRMIAERLKKGGVFYIIEFHPIAWMFDYQKEKPSITYGYSQKEVIYEEYKGTYADTNADMISKEYGWNHGLGEVVSSLSEAGLTIEYLREYDASPYNIFPKMIKNKQGMYERINKLYPLLFAIKAFK